MNDSKKTTKEQNLFSENLFEDMLSDEELVVIHGGGDIRPTCGDGCGMGCGSGCGLNCSGC